MRWGSGRQYKLSHFSLTSKKLKILMNLVWLLSHHQLWVSFSKVRGSYWSCISFPECQFTDTARELTQLRISPTFRTPPTWRKSYPSQGKTMLYKESSPAPLATPASPAHLTARLDGTFPVQFPSWQMSPPTALLLPLHRILSLPLILIYFFCIAGFILYSGCCLPVFSKFLLYIFPIKD